MLIKNRVTEKGHAKINLHLDITGRLADGFHSVSTVMQTVSLCDEITVCDLKETEGEPSFTAYCGEADLPSDGRNLAVRAALLFCNAANISLVGRIEIKKNIPMAAGMAGGSADAAAVLRSLNKATDEPFSLEELCALGASLGADVPFCIVGGTAFADGKGDILHTLPDMPDCIIVAACEGEGVSTPWAYRLLDGIYGDFAEGCGYAPKDISCLTKALDKGDVRETAKNIYNIFEGPVLAERPVAAHIKELMLEGGALSAMMSGSGPSVFGIFDCSEHAERACDLLSAQGYTPYLTRPTE